MTKHANSRPDTETDDLDPNSLAAIRDLLAGEEQGDLHADVAPNAAEAAATAPKTKRSLLSPLAPQKQVDEKPQKQKKMKQPKPARAPKAEGTGMLDQLKAKVLGYRPTPKHIVLACLALLVYFRPWLMVGLLFLFSFILIGVFLILGYDGFWRRAIRLARWYAEKHPSRSAELHRKLDNFAMRFDAFLDRFPEGTVDGLYLPDLGALADAEARHDEALDRRFDNLRENEA